jgi:hypothetical protein
MKRRLVVIGLFASSLAAAEPLDEQPRLTIVHGKLDGATATFRAHYLIHVERATLGRLRWAIELPPSASVIGGSARFRGTSHRLELVDAADGMTRLDALGARPPGGSSRWAVLLDGGADQVHVSIASAQTGELALELEVQAPTCFRGDVRYVSVPGSWKRALAGPLRTRAVPRPDEAACPGDGNEHASWLGFPTGETRTAPDRMAAFAGRVALGATHVARLELDVAGKLADAPRDLATAIVVDSSSSLSLGERAAQRSFVAAYLREAPASRVQVIAYARGARSLLPSWTTAASARPLIDRELLALAPANGSNLDAALAEAARWLARVHGTRRILLLTDGRIAKRFGADPAQLKTLAAPDTLIHVGSVGSHHGVPARDSHSTLEPLARATRGVAFSTGVIEDHESIAWLIRPMSIDDLHIKAPGWTRRRESTCETELREGTSCTWWAEGTALAGPIAVAGFVWGREVVRIVQPDAAHAVSVARGLAKLRNDGELQASAELAARAVNAKWSLYVEWGGPDGYDDRLLRASCCHGIRTGGTRGGLVGIGRAVPGPRRPPLDLHPQLAGVVAACRPGGAQVTAEVETTLAEIVAVSVTVEPVQPALKTCVEEAIWNASLVVPKHYPHEHTRVAFGSP